jgi:ribosomal protein L23
MLTTLKNANEMQKNYRYNNVIIKTILTEKSTQQLDKFATYVFEISSKSTKQDVMLAVWNIFGIKPIKVNVLVTARKKIKKAMVTLKPEDVIFLEKK